ncbi:MAG: uroporphyrinogen decarboxylase [Waddliaceae bacterium]
MMIQLFLDALHCRNQSRTPIWLMRQAGRYIPEYRAIRQKHSFLEMCRQPELAAEITSLPIRIFGMDAAILFSDILVIPDALGVGVHFKDGTGPIIERPLNGAGDVKALPKPNIREVLNYVGKAIRYVTPELKVPLIGFCGGPFTVASYMVEGGSSRDFKKTKQWMFRDPVSFHELLSKITEASIEYLRLQIDSGVQAIQIFDSWANVLDYPSFRDFSLEYLRRMMLALVDSKIPVIIFCRGSSCFAKDIAEIHPNGISLDWNANLVKMRSIVPSHVALQGNLDPDVLYASPEVIKREAERLLHGMVSDPGYIFNLGHGMKPDIPVDAVKTLIEAIKNFRL